MLAPTVPAGTAVLESRQAPVLRIGPARGIAALAVLDRLAGAILFLASLPLILIAAALICALSRRSPFVAHLRVGQRGHPFWVWKLRTMWPSATPPSRNEIGWVQRVQADPQTETKPRSDPRVTSRFAAFCRRHSIDELPQLLHVLCGRMSLVGPRPLTRSELHRHYGPGVAEILALKPGLTGYWQTRGRSRLSYPQRAALDYQLARELSGRLYFQLLLQTLPELLHGKNAW